MSALILFVGPTLFALAVIGGIALVARLRRPSWPSLYLVEGVKLPDDSADKKV